MYAKKRKWKIWNLQRHWTVRFEETTNYLKELLEIVVCDHHEEEIIEESVRILTVSLI